MVILSLANFWHHWVKRPSPNTPRPSLLRWVIPGTLALGPLPHPGDDEQLARAGIKAIVSLCSEAEGTLPAEMTAQFLCLRSFLPDSHYDAPLTVSSLAQTVQLVRQNVESQLPVYVHCLAAVERSPTVCIAYLCRYHNLELWEALNALKQVNPRTSPTEAQLQVVREWLTTQ